MWSINKHFKTESALLLAIAFLPIVVNLLVWLGLSAWEWFAINKCFDSGGLYIASDRTCRFERKR